MRIDVKLKEILEDLDIKPNRLSVESKVRSNTIYELVENKKNGITFDTLSNIIAALNRLAEQEGKPHRYSVEDILEYIEEK